jgi:hypothetical protein
VYVAEHACCWSLHLQNHHLAASFHLINSDEYNWMPKVHTSSLQRSAEPALIWLSIRIETLCQNVPT